MAVLISSAVGAVALAGTVAADPHPAPTPPASAPNPGQHPSPDPGQSRRPSPQPPTSTPSRHSSKPPHSPSAQPSRHPQPDDSQPGHDDSQPGHDDDPALYDISGQVRAAINDFVAWVAAGAINQAMSLLGSTVLATPELAGNGRVAAVWTTSMVVANSLFVLLIVLGGLVVTANGTLHNRHGLKEILPRIGLAAIASNTSLLLCGKAIEAANAITAAIAGKGVDAHAAAAYLSAALNRLQNSGTFLISMLELAIVVAALVVVVTFILRTMVLVILIGVAPLALALHALPQTESLAYTWWRALAGCLVLQVAQAVVLVAMLRVFLSPTDSMFLGLPDSKKGLLDVLVALAMLVLLAKLPGLTKRFVLGAGGGRGLVRQVISTILMIKTLGAATGVLHTGTRHTTTRTARNRLTVGQQHIHHRRLSASAATRSAGGGAAHRPAPAAFSHAPVTHTPLSRPAGAAGAPTFSTTSTPSTPLRPAASADTTQPPAFSHRPQPASSPPPSAASTAPPAFSHAPSPPATPPSAPAPTPQPPAFSDAPPTQTAPRRPPAPTRPVFSDPRPRRRARPPRGGPSGRDQ